MKHLIAGKALLLVLLFTAVLALSGCAVPLSIAAPNADNSQPSRPGLVFVDYRDLNGGSDGVALMDLDPESEAFGEIIQKVEIGSGVLPHHLYFNQDQSRLYTSALSGANLYELILETNKDGIPQITEVVPVDTAGNQVGEDIYFTKDGSRYYMTFMGGDGSDTGGSVGVFDARTNELIKTIEASVSADPATSEPFILYPHGISANEEVGLLMVSSTIHADMQTGIGNTVTAIDLETDTPVKTYLVSESWDEFSSPVEVILLRDELPPYALVTTMLSGDIWIAAYDEDSGLYEEFSKVIEGEESDLSWPLEFYIYTNHLGQQDLYVSFANPGVINVYSLHALPELPLKRTLPAGAGAHHMLFFDTASGREVVAVQNNLLNLDGLNQGTVNVIDIYTGEVLATLDMPAEHGLMPESVESAFGHGHDYHH